MILHSIRIGNRHIHVRTNDCDQRELERVHETVWFVWRMLQRDGCQACGLLAGLVAWLASMWLGVSLFEVWDYRGAPSVLVGLVTAVGGWFLILNFTRRYQLADAARLWTLTAESIRCRDFVIECTEASPALSRIRIRRPQPA